jgi:hypothetical protein
VWVHHEGPTVGGPVQLNDVFKKNPRNFAIFHFFEGYTHKTSGFKTSGFKTSETSGLQNVRFTKRQVFKTSCCKKTSIHILYLWLVEIRRFCCSHVCWKSDGCVLFSILEVFLPYITIIGNNDTLFTLREYKLGNSYPFCLISI